jgi:hypothetical protein
MRTIATLVLAFSLGLAASVASSPAPAAPVDSLDINGSWKLVVILPAGELDFAIFDVKQANGKIAATAGATLPSLGPIKTAEWTVDGNRVAIQLVAPGDPTCFRGVIDKDGSKAKGLIRFKGVGSPARIERTQTKELIAGRQPPPMARELAQAQAIKGPKERVAKIRELIDGNPESPMNPTAYAQILVLAEAADLGPEEVGKLVEKWVDEASLYGPEWTAETQVKALSVLQGREAYASIATELALAAEKALPADATLDQRSTLANLLARSARLAAKDEVASGAEGRVKELDGKLDAEYRDKVPTFKPEPYAGRPGSKGNRVVLMEIFTGTQCSPCVAADVAFDALLKTYRPSEFIGLQYHLHIPGPDPLTNADTISRQAYYGSKVQGTPSSFFNGKSQAGGGGAMADSEKKYEEYRKAIEPALDSEKPANITLTATRSGDEVKIAATATATTGGSSKEARVRLRLVLIEESVRYTGFNKLRFHHNVVRAFPGGIEGKAFEKGEANVETSVKLSDLRKAQDEYLARYPSSKDGRPFPYPLPPMALDDLAVVALIQDDTDHGVWHAAQVPVRAEAP